MRSGRLDYLYKLYAQIMRGCCMLGLFCFVFKGIFHNLAEKSRCPMTLLRTYLIKMTLSFVRNMSNPEFLNCPSHLRSVLGRLG